MAPSEIARRSPVTHIRHVAISTADFAGALAFYEGVWGLYQVAGDSELAFLGTVGSPEPFVVRLRRAAERRTDLIAFAATGIWLGWSTVRQFGATANRGLPWKKAG